MLEGSQKLPKAEATAKAASMSEKPISKEVKRLEKLMVDHGQNLEFGKAVQVRDQLHVLKQQAFRRLGRWDPPWPIWGRKSASLAQDLKPRVRAR